MKIKIFGGTIVFVGICCLVSSMERDEHDKFLSQRPPSFAELVRRAGKPAGRGRAISLPGGVVPVVCVADGGIEELFADVAARGFDAEIKERLAKLKVQIILKARDAEGKTFLHYAVLKNDVILMNDLVTRIFSYSSSDDGKTLRNFINVRDSAGKTARNYAVDLENGDAAEFLKMLDPD